MKFWKLTLLTTISFLAFSITVLYTSCEKDPCTDVSCKNGGSCGNGVCRCPTGYENTQCQDKAVTRYLGVYGGFITCNAGDEVIDSVSIYRDSSSAAMINYVWVVWKAIKPKVLHGYVYNNESAYSIVVPNEGGIGYTKIYTITLQNYGITSQNNKLSIHSYEKDATSPGDTVQTECAFLGFKH